MSFYVKRTHTDGRSGWVGPIRSERQAAKEAAAWESDGGWVAWVEESTPAIKCEVRAWQKARNLALGR
jgi:hypothetical protein